LTFGAVRRRPMAWLSAMRLYGAAILAANLVWEAMQLPLYTIWQAGAPREIAFAVVHCAGGDLAIAAGTLLLALLAVGRSGWPNEGFVRVSVASVVLGVGYTIYSEWLNVTVRRSWAYSDLMPIVPVLEVGLSPLLQWIVIPVGALIVARRFATG
jgi:hypothetical protein